MNKYDLFRPNSLYFRWLRPHRLSRRLLAILGVSLFLTSIATLGATYTSVRSHFEKEERKEISLITRSLQLTIETFTTSDPVFALEDITKRYSELPNVIGVAIIDADGTLLTYNSQKQEDPGLASTYIDLVRLIQRVLPTQTESYHRIKIRDESVLVHFLPFDSRKAEHFGQRGFAIVAMELEEIQQTNRNFLLTSSTIMLTMSLVLLGTTGTLVKASLLNPLKRLTKAAQSSDDADSFLMPEPLPQHKIHFLAETFNATFQKPQLAEKNLQRRNNQLRNQNRVLSRLTQHRAISYGDLQSAIQEVTEATVQTLDVGRVSVWLYDKTKTHLNCFDLFQQAQRQHSEGMSLSGTDYPAYFRAIAHEENPIAVYNAHTDPRTVEFSRSYLTPFNIESILDTPIRLGGQTIGVLCIEHLNQPRHWQPEDESFARSIADILALAIEARDRQQVQESLAESEKRFKELVNNIPGAVYHRRCDAHWTMDFISPAIANIAGYSASGFCHNRLRSFASIVVPEDMAQVETTILQAIALKHPYILEYRIVHANGLFRWVYEKGQGVFDDNGELQYLDGVIFDISDRKLTEAALRKSEATQQALIQAIPDLLIRMKQDGTYLGIQSPGSINLFNPSQSFVGNNIRNILPVEIADKRMHDIQQVLKTRKVHICEQQLVVNGTLQYEEVRITPCGEDEVLIMVRNISDRKLAEIQIQQQSEELATALRELKLTQTQIVQSEKMSSLGQMVAGVAHEINNPISFIYGNINYANNYLHDLLNLVSLYQTHYPDPHPKIQAQMEVIELDFLTEDLPSLLSSMKVGAERIREIVRSLRCFARSDEAEIKLANVQEGIDSTLMILHSRLRETPNRPEIEIVKYYGDLPYIDCHPGPLNQVFMNILSNAIDALEKSHEQQVRKCSVDNVIDEITPVKALTLNPNCIRIYTELINHENIRIRIADNGLGMTEEVYSKLFDPFFTTKPVGKGTGLGLSISYQIIVEKHGGKLYCHSLPGQGSEFVIELPIYQRFYRAA